MNIIDTVKSLILPSPKKTSLDTQEFARDLEKIKTLFPEDQNLGNQEDYEDLWMYMSGILEINLWKHQAVIDSLGWYRRSFLLSPQGWELKTLGGYTKSPQESLNDVMTDKYCIYEYIN